jgi:hypothetical protein
LKSVHPPAGTARRFAIAPPKLISASVPRTFLTTASLCLLLAACSTLPAQTDVQLTIAAADTTPLPDAPLPSLNQQAQQATTLNTRQQTQQPQQTPTTTAPSLDDLGLTPAQTKADPDMQHRLDRRTHMLKVHQELGLWTVIPIAAACISGAGATPDRNTYGDTTSRDVHVGIAALGIGMYGATAYYAIRAPRVPDGPVRGGIKIHKYLIWIHAPGMILTPILGTMAFNDIASGHKPSGIEQYHSAVALTTAIAYGASIIAVSWPIHIPFTHHSGS